MSFRPATIAAFVGAYGVFTVAPASAQTPANSNQSFAVIEGVAVDSLHGGYLRGAVLIVEGAKVTAITDANGRFRIDSVPPGVRRINVVHPILDTVGLSLVTPALQIAAGQHLELVLATPSAKTILSLKCSPAERAVGPDALLGLVQYAESEEPAAGSKVTLEWMDYESLGNALRSMPRRRVATVAANGRFQICGLPAELSATLTAAHGRDTTAAIDVHINSLIGIVALELPEPDIAESPVSGAPGAAGAPVSPTARGGHATLTGRVLDPAGSTLARARVSVDADSAFALTGTDGRFTLNNLRAGTRSVTVRRLGFEPADVVVNVRSRTPTDITVRLGAFVPVLDTVRITATATQRGLDRVGFNRRKTTASGYYLTPEQISRRNALELPDLLTMAPMLRRSYRGSHAVITGRPQGAGHGCVSYFVDGVQWMGGGIEDFIYPTEVGAIEVYSSGFTPPEFTRGLTQCETVVIWTKQKIGIR